MSKENVHSYFGSSLSREIFLALTGEELGSGSCRTVLAHPHRDDLVIKIDTRAGSFQNIMEWEAWKELKDTPWARQWLAPCVSISPFGSVLVMKRTTKPMPNQYPDKIPAFLTDTKRTNYGMLNKRFVCHDYGVNMLMLKGMTKRMHKANWWDE